MNQVLTADFMKYIAGEVVRHHEDLYIAIGSGDGNWDNNGLPDVDPTVDSLLSEEARLPVSKVEFVDSNNEVSAVPTSKISIVSSRFSAEEYEGPVRECGLFYGTGEDSELILYSVFPRIMITPQIALTKSLSIDFT